MTGGSGRSPIVFAAALTLAAGVALAGCAPEDEPPLAGEVLRPDVDMMITGMKTALTRSGIRRAYLEADTAEFVGEGEIRMRPVKLTFYDDRGAEISFLVADHGVLFEATDDMEANGNIVVLDRREDRRLETQRLRYSSAEDRLRGDVPFTMTRDAGRTVIRGNGFESDPGLDSLQIVQPAGRSERPGAARPDSPPAGERTVAPDSAGASSPAAAPAGEAGEPPAIPEPAPPDSIRPDSTAARHRSR